MFVLMGSHVPEEEPIPPNTLCVFRQAVARRLPQHVPPSTAGVYIAIGNQKGLYRAFRSLLQYHVAA